MSAFKIRTIILVLIIALSFTIIFNSRDYIAFAIIYENNYINTTNGPLTSNDTIDKFGIKKIYPTKEGGREWFINMDNPKDDNIFSITSDPNITKQNDGSWHIAEPKVRMNIDTPLNTEPWKNVEITGYVKVISKISPIDADLSWYARGGKHNWENPCEGTALKGVMHDDSTTGWEKEIWHTGGDTNILAKTKFTNSIIGKWVGLKVIMYNINNDSYVKMESYIDKNNNNNWTKVTDLIDNGKWNASSTDSEFYSAGCNRPKDYIVTNPGTIVTFRSDNITWDFKNLSVREINPPVK